MLRFGEKKTIVNRLSRLSNLHGSRAADFLADDNSNHGSQKSCISTETRVWNEANGEIFPSNF